MIHGVYAITSDNCDGVEDLLSRTEKIILGGAQVIQFRDKHSSSDEKLARARALADLCKQYRLPLIVNDDVELAHKVSAQGVHLGKHDASIAHAKQTLGNETLVGVSCYASLRRAVQGQQHGATYVAFGAVFSSPTKPMAERVPLDLITLASDILDVPIVAIGGITHDNAQSVVDAGADAIAVISAVYDADDCKATTAALAALFKRECREDV